MFTERKFQKLRKRVSDVQLDAMALLMELQQVNELRSALIIGKAACKLIGEASAELYELGPVKTRTRQDDRLLTLFDDPPAA